LRASAAGGCWTLADQRAFWCVEVYTPWGGGMPPGLGRRAGSRPGTISAELEAALAREAMNLAAVTDAVDQVKAVNDFFAQLDYELEAVARVRLQAVADLRGEGWSYDRIAAATGLSKARVAQLSRAARAAGRRVRRAGPST
jgi:hypothetical protein